MTDSGARPASGMAKATLLETQFLCPDPPGCAKADWNAHRGSLQELLVTTPVLTGSLSAHRRCVKEANGSLNHF
jgi:hypothetical protein